MIRYCMMALKLRLLTSEKFESRKSYIILYDAMLWFCSVYEFIGETETICYYLVSLVTRSNLRKLKVFQKI